jgi:hypothetical protein
MRAPRKPIKKSRPLPRALLFWGGFFLVVALLFLINIPKITQTWKNVMGKTAAESDSAVQPESESAQVESPGNAAVFPPSAPDTLPLGETLDAAPPAAEPDAGQTAPLPERAAEAESAGAPVEKAERGFRERSVFLVKVDENTGFVFLSPGKRMIPVNDSPLISTLNALLQGPTAEEKRLGLISLIPPGTRVLGAAVDRNIAVINFNDAFLFNSYGAEGYLNQLRQIIWTATEFPNIHAVQIHIDGKKIEFLGETIRIDRPYSRDSL